MADFCVGFCHHSLLDRIAPSNRIYFRLSEERLVPGVRRREPRAAERPPEAERGRSLWDPRGRVGESTHHFFSMFFGFFRARAHQIVRGRAAPRNRAEDVLNYAKCSILAQAPFCETSSFANRSIGYGVELIELARSLHGPHSSQRKLSIIINERNRHSLAQKR
jgi:hypothetical protein